MWAAKWVGFAELFVGIEHFAEHGIAGFAGAGGDDLGCPLRILYGDLDAAHDAALCEAVDVVDEQVAEVFGDAQGAEVLFDFGGGHVVRM